MHDEDAGARVLQDVGHLGRGDADVHRNQDRAGRGHGEVQLEHLRDVRQEGGDAVAGRDAALDERGRGTGAAVDELAVGDRPVVPAHRRPVAPHRPGMREQVQRAERRV